MNDESSRAPGPSAPGMRVRRTGIALVHEGELIMPAPGSEAVLGADAGSGSESAQYVFPVEIEVLSPPDPPDVQAVVDEALSQLARSLGVF